MYAPENVPLFLPLTHHRNTHINTTTMHCQQKVLFYPTIIREIPTPCEGSGINHRTHISPLISSLIIDDSHDSFLCGILPTKRTLAKVTSVFKKRSWQDKNKYRPILVLSLFSKIFEKALLKCLYDHLESCNILYPLQSGLAKVLDKSCTE